MQPKNNKDKEGKEKSLYCDIGSFKGFSFQNNVDSINKLFFGLSLSLSENTYIFKNEEDGKYYLSAYCFRIIPENKTNIKKIYYPTSFLNLIFYHKNIIFFIRSNNELSIYKLNDDNQCKNYVFFPQFSAKYQTPKKEMKLKSKKILSEKENEEISDKLDKIDNSNLKSTYEMLCDILKNNLKENLMDKSKEIHSKMTYFIEIDDLKFTCEFEKESKEIDSVGHLREPISVTDEEVLLKKGIENLKTYIKLKRNKDNSAENYIKNDFKCPILYKNFNEKIIPSNKAFLCEIKAGFAIEDVAEQIEKRIELIKNCFFNDGKKPEYFIGIINLNSKNVDKLAVFLNYTPNFEDKVLIISAVDYEYFGMDISYEINTNYLLFKKIDTLKNEIKNELNREMAIQRQELKDEISKLGFKIDSFIDALK